MPLPRACVKLDGFERESRSGDGLLMAPKISTITTAGNLTISASAIRGGIARFTGAAGAVTYTTPTAAQLNAVFDDVNIGETVCFILSNTAAQPATVAGGTDVTAVAGNLVVNGTSKTFVLEKTSDTTWNIYGL